MIKPIQLDSTLAEFTYTIAREAPISLRRLLPEKYYRAINSEVGAMKFATRSTFEQKREFFSYLGVEHFTIFADMRRGEATDFREILRQFDTEDKPHVLLRKLADANVYISSNKEFCSLLGFASQVIDTDGYNRNMELVRTGYHIKGFKNKITIPEYVEGVKEKDAAMALIKTIRGVLGANNYCKDITGVDSEGLQILIYLYLNKHTYFTQEKLSEVFLGEISGRKIAASRLMLMKEMLIQKHPSQNRNDYTITAKGILIVNQFRDKVIKSFDF